MKVRLINGRAIDAPIRERWQQLQQANPALVSPYFCVEFTEAVAQTRADVEVAIIEELGKLVAFFPYHRSARSVAVPVGSCLSDYQGIICAPGFACEPQEVLRACSLVAWDFDHLIATQAFFAKYHRHIEPSAQMDLSNGYDSYTTERRAAGSEQIKKCQNLMRRIEREVGPLRFVIHATDPRLFSQVLAWKSQQYWDSDKPDLFGVDWIRAVVERIYAAQTAAFAGMLSVLYAGDQLVAGHFGMRSAKVWHYWFPSYDPKLSRYSPGLILLLKMAQSASLLGLLTIDLGKGLHLYKHRLMNSAVMVADGSVELQSWLSFRREAMRKLKAGVAATPLRAPLRRLAHLLRGNL